MKNLSVALLLFAGLAQLRADPAAIAGRIAESATVSGGLIVHVGCGTGELTAALRTSERHLVHGLDTGSANIAAARELIRSRGLYGPVSVATFGGAHLPYADDLVNLVVVSHGSAVSEAELLRVLVPGGVLLALDGSSAIVRRLVKPRPASLDDWTHFLYGPGNNAVSRDGVVGPVGSLKWRCGPLWSRSHEFTSSLSILVSAGGRVFYVVDEGLTSITTPNMPERWVLIARDAFNGKLLWRLPLPEWRSRLGGRTALRSVPPTAQRCLVAAADRVFVSSLLGAPIRELDAATGAVLKTYPSTAGTREFVKTDAALFVYREQAADKGQGSIGRLDLGTGELAWASPKTRYRGESLGASRDVVVYHTGQALVCLAAADGRELWRAGQDGQRGKGRRGAATYIVHRDTVLECGSNLIVARRAVDGQQIWESKTGGRAMRGHDGFVARGCVWHAAGDAIVGYDLATGKPARTVDPTDVQSEGHHLRCYRAKATENYLITQYRGVEFVSIAGGENTQTDWTRGACSFGVVPANGLLYVPPNPCFCYPGVKIRGLNALAPRQAPPQQDSARLSKGAAYTTRDRAAATDLAAPWPTYRHDRMRHGSTRTGVPARVAVRWEADLGGVLSPPVMAGGMVYVAVKDQHAVCALDAASGKTVWRFAAGARIDSPPTIHGEYALFGSADGHLYCVTARTGALVWRFRAAPYERMIMISDQLESAWPVHGSVLVRDNVVYCSAGRSSMLDGGIWLYGLDVPSGDLLFETSVDTLSRVREDAAGKPLIPAYVMEGTHSDILVSEGDAIYMGTMTFDLQLKRQPTPHAMDADHTTVAMDISRGDYIAVDGTLQRGGYQAYRSFHRYQERAWPAMTEQYKETYGGMNLGDMTTGLHIAPTAGFLDDTWFNRTYWMYSTVWPGWYHAHRGAKTGNLLVVGRQRTYAVQAYPERNMQSPLFTPGKDGYLLVADANDNEPVLDFKTRGATKGVGFTRTKPPAWHDWVPIRIRAMVAAADTLFVAGPPDAVSADDPTAALQGRAGAVLRAVSAADGVILSEHRLGAPPVFDGLIAAAGSLFMSTVDHRLVCLAGAAETPSAEEQAAVARLRTEQAARRKLREAAAQKRTFGREGVPLGEQKSTAGKKAASGKRLPNAQFLSREGWRIAHVSTAETKAPGFAPSKLLDGDPMTSWHSKWVGGRDPFPHVVVIDLGKAADCRGIAYLPRQDRAQNGRIRDYAVYVSVDGEAWGEPAAEGAFPNALDEQLASFEAGAVRYIKLVAKSGYDKDLTAVSELNVLEP